MATLTVPAGMTVEVVQIRVVDPSALYVAVQEPVIGTLVCAIQGSTSDKNVTVEITNLRIISISPGGEVFFLRVEGGKNGGTPI